MLNLITLQIADKEISAEYSMMRAKQFNKHLMPITVISSLYFVARLVQFLSDQETPAVRVFSASYNVIHCLMWIVFARLKP